MVSPIARGWVVSVLVLAALGAGPAPGPAGPGADDPSRAVGSALGKGSFPWYDALKDEIRTVGVRPDPASRGSASSASGPASKAAPGSGWSPGDFIAFAGFATAILALVALLAWFWRLYEPVAQAGPDADPRAGQGRIEELPAGLRREFESSDPWAEAARRRDRGDLDGAIVCLFAHQLLALSRLGQVRLAPGRTGRQLIRGIADPGFRDLVQPTLRQFEAVFYGHRSPTPDEFAAVWSAAEAFERRAAAGVAP